MEMALVVLWTIHFLQVERNQHTILGNGIHFTCSEMGHNRFTS